MGLDNLLATLEKRDSVTVVTPVTSDDVTLKPAWIKACTSVTPVTAEKTITANTEWRRQKVIAMLERYPDTQRAIFADTESDPRYVILAVAVRACMQTCEMLIPKTKYDPWKLLELVERHGSTTH